MNIIGVLGHKALQIARVVGVELALNGARWIHSRVTTFSVKLIIPTLHSGSGIRRAAAVGVDSRRAPTFEFSGNGLQAA